MIVKTESSTYILDVADGVLTRVPNEEAGEIFPVAQLRMDHQIVPYKLGRPLKVGERALFILDIRNDGVKTWRETTPVVSIED